MDPGIEKKRLLESVPISPEELLEAEEIFAEAKRKLALSKSVLSSIAASMMHVAFTKDPVFETMAVKLTGDGNPILVLNTDFLKKIGAAQAVFGLCHEVGHLLNRHLHVNMELNLNPNWITATESTINRRVMLHTGLPLITIDGEVAIVDPKKVYERYRDGMKKISKEPVSQDQFFITDLATFAALEELPKPLKPKGIGVCVHAGDGEGHGDGHGPAPLDQSEVDKFIGKVIEATIQEAKNGRPGAKEEILSWMDATPEAAKAWGNYGAGVLRGETAKTSRTDMWERWTADILGSKMEDGNKLRYQKKVPWDPRVTAHGKQPKKYGSVFVDTSGSMQQEVLDKVAALVGELEEIDVEWHCFDGDVWPFTAGEPFRGGGGTSFQIIDDHVTNGGYRNGTSTPCCDENLDFVLVITDGYAPHISPKNPDNYIWLITPGGDEWPSQANMSCRVIELP